MHWQSIKNPMQLHNNSRKKRQVQLQNKTAHSVKETKSGTIIETCMHRQSRKNQYNYTTCMHIQSRKNQVQLHNMQACSVHKYIKSQAQLYNKHTHQTRKVKYSYTTYKKKHYYKYTCFNMQTVKYNFLTKREPQ